MSFRHNFLWNAVIILILRQAILKACSVLTQIFKSVTRSLIFYPWGPERRNSIELVEILFGTMNFFHFSQRTIYKSLAKYLSMLIFTRFEEIINNNTMRKNPLCIKKESNLSNIHKALLNRSLKNLN